MPPAEPVVGGGDGSSSGLSDDEKAQIREEKEIREEEEDLIEDQQSQTASDPELILTCFVLMLDVAYKQVGVLLNKNIFTTTRLHLHFSNL